MEEFVKFLRDDCKISPYCFVGLPSEEKLDEIWGRVKEGVTWTGKGDVSPFLCTVWSSMERLSPARSSEPKWRVQVVCRGQLLGILF